MFYQNKFDAQIQRRFLKPRSEGEYANLFLRWTALFMFLYQDRVHIWELFWFHFFTNKSISIITLNFKEFIPFEWPDLKHRRYKWILIQKRQQILRNNHIDYLPQIFILARQKENCDSEDSVFYGGKITPVVGKHWKRLSFWIN